MTAIGPAVTSSRAGDIGVRAPLARSRIAYIDNLRWVMILLVVSMHSADTYSPLGNWYFTDRVPISQATLVTFAAWQMYLQAFFMGLLFFVAGYFVPASFDRKGPRRFIRDRAFRLGLPVLFYMFILGPVTEYFFSHSWNSTEPTSFANEWIKHIRNGQFMQENGPLWFCLALLIFSVVYALISSSNTSQPSAVQPDERSPTTSRLMGFALVMAGFEFLIRLTLPGVTFLNMHLGDFAQYILLFAAGILAARQGWLPRLSYSAGVRWLLVIVPVGFAAWFALLIGGGAFHGRSELYFGGWHWQSAAVDMWECVTCVAISFGLLVLFREHFNSQGAVGKFLSDNAFSVYVFHPPIVITGALLLRGVPWHPLVKFGLLTAVGVIVSFVLSAAVFRRMALLRRIL